MITANSIINEINRLMVIAFPEAQAHINACPEGFERPAYLIRCTKFELSDVNRSTVAVSAAFEITYMPPLNKDQLVECDALLEAQDAVLAVFAAGRIKILDRSLRIAAAQGKPMTDGTIITIRMDYYDDRPAAAVNLPKMSAVETKTTLE